jgi:DNA repair exonuclease SbcCD ATPase subunit
MKIGKREDILEKIAEMRARINEISREEAIYVTIDPKKITIKNDKLKKDIDDLNDRRIAIGKKIMESDKLRDSIKGLDVLISDNKFVINKFTEELQKIISSLDNLEYINSEIAEKKDLISNIEKENSKINNEIELLTLIKTAFGSSGVKTIVIDYIIPQFEERINEILSRLSDFRIELETNRKDVSGEKDIDGLFINIYNESSEKFDFDSYSGGERLKIIVAISEALAEIQNFGFRILDELFIGLDEESIDSFAEVVNKLQDRFSQLICISHLRTIKDSFSDRITVNKINGISTIS